MAPDNHNWRKKAYWVSLAEDMNWKWWLLWAVVIFAGSRVVAYFW